MANPPPSDTMSLEVSASPSEEQPPLLTRIWAFISEAWIPGASTVRILCAMFAAAMVLILVVDRRPSSHLSVVVGRVALISYAAVGFLAARRMSLLATRLYISTLAIGLPLFALYSALEANGSPLSIGLLGIAVLAPMLFALSVLDLIVVTGSLIIGHAIVLAWHPVTPAIGTDNLRVLWLCTIALGVTVALSLIVYRHQQRVNERNLAAARDDAIATSQAKSELMANLSDKIRTPMNGIIGLVDLVLDTDMSEEQRRYLSMVQTDADRLMLLLNDLLDLSKMHAQKLKLDIKTFNLPDLLRATMTPLALRAEERNLDFEWETTNKLPVWVKGDPRRLRQILVNLIDNALKFTRKGQISIVVKRPQGIQKRRNHVAFSVKDSGPGIPRDKLELVRSSSMKVDATNARSSEGAGLGLAICTQLVSLMDGRIVVASNAQGSTIDFTVHLPADKAKEEQRQEQSLQPIADAPTIAKVLLVEDNATNRVFAERVMQKAGHAVMTAENGQVALEQIRQHDFDIVFMDVQMPVMDGLEAARAIREHERDTNSPTVPIVALTAHVLEEQIQLCLKAGMTVHLGKPVYGSDLLDTIHQLLGESEPGAVQPATRISGTIRRSPTVKPFRAKRDKREPSARREPSAKREPSAGTSPNTDRSTETPTRAPVEQKVDVVAHEVAPERAPRANIFDSGQLLDMLANDRELIETMLFELMKQQATVITDLRPTLKANDCASAAKHAHKLKGSLLTLCAHESAKTASELEQLLRANDIDSGRTKLEVLVSDLDELNAELRSQGFSTDVA